MSQSDPNQSEDKLPPEQKSDQPSTPGSSGGPSNRLFYLALFLLIGCFLTIWLGTGETSRSSIPYSFFLKQVEQGNVAKVQWVDTRTLVGEFAEGKIPFDPAHVKKLEKAKAEGEAEADEEPRKLKEHFRVDVPPPATQTDTLDKILRETEGLEYSADTSSEWFGAFFLAYLPILLTVAIFGGFLYIMMRRTRDQMGGSSFLGNFNRSPMKRYEPDQQRITFDDVAGLESVKAELEEMVEFLKNPVKFQRLGGRVPKGTLLMGPPGTGKTLLAKAVAGEAGVPFFSINGSEFIQLFVGVGAMRVRDLFRTAKEVAPCIVFIDEIDAVGRVRGAGFGGGHDEREQTLNQILSEMDGFSPSESVIVVAATNRPDVLDPALLRPGRFDRHITVDRPSLKGRIGLFKVHTRNIPIADDVDLEALARGTVGLTGADIRNLVNEAALWATREGKEKVDMSDFEFARDKVLMGPKRDEVILGKEKELTAYHEAGHALLAWVVPGADPVQKVSIIPRGRALGVTLIYSEEDRFNISEKDLRAKLIYILGGRAAEKLVYDEFSAGAENDLKQATRIARRMVTHWGMSERLGPVAFRTDEENPFLGKEMTEHREFSEHTAQIIDEEVASILHNAAQQATELLSEHRQSLEDLAKALLEEETLGYKRLEAILGESVNKPLPIEPTAEESNGKPHQQKADEGAESESEGESSEAESKEQSE